MPLLNAAGLATTSTPTAPPPQAPDAAGPQPADAPASLEILPSDSLTVDATAAAALPGAPLDEPAPAPATPPLPDVVAETTATLATTSVPLGLIDALGILRAAESLLGPPDFPPSAPRIAQATARVDAVARYMELIAEAMHEQVRYEWHSMGRMGVKPGASDTKRLPLSIVQRGVLALRVRAAKTDLHLSSVKVEDVQSSRSQTLAPNLDLAGDLPKWEVIYLDAPVNVAAVTVTAHHSGTEKRRLLIEVGVPRPPDYSREVAALCRQSQALWRDGHDAEARAALARAVTRLNDFRESLTSIRPRKPAAQ